MTERASFPSPRPGLSELVAYHSPQVDVPVRLNTNESPFPPPAAFVDAWLAALRSQPLHRYPDRAASDLRTRLAASVGVPAERVFCANGSNEVLQTLLLAYGGAGRRALVFEPTYALHGHISRITMTEVAVAARAADFRIDPTEAAAAVAATQPAIVFLCSPNNPTGTVDEPAVLDAVLDAARSTSALIVVDEAYGEFARESALGRVAEDVPLVVVRTYSKVWSLAALRLGFCAASERVVTELEKVVLPYHLSAATQTAGLEALRFSAQMAERVDALRRGRERLVSGLRAQDGLEVFPSGANFVLVRSEPDAHALWQRLIDHGVLVRDFSARPGLEGCLRITVGTVEENEALLAAMVTAIEEVAA